MRPSGLVGLLLVSGHVLLAVISPSIVPYDYTTQNAQLVLANPSTEHWLGGDHLGRDVPDPHPAGRPAGAGHHQRRDRARNVLGRGAGTGAGPLWRPDRRCGDACRRRLPGDSLDHVPAPDHRHAGYGRHRPDPHPGVLLRHFRDPASRERQRTTSWRGTTSPPHGHAESRR